MIEPKKLSGGSLSAGEPIPPRVNMVDQAIDKFRCRADDATRHLSQINLDIKRAESFLAEANVFVEARTDGLRWNPQERRIMHLSKPFAETSMATRAGYADQLPELIHEAFAELDAFLAEGTDSDG